MTSMHSMTQRRPHAPVSAQRTLHAFDLRSVMLLTALTLGGSPALYAQTSPAPSPPSHSTKARATPEARTGRGSGTAQSSAASAAFDRADANADGKLSPQEAQQLPAIGNRFEQLDSNRDGFLSRPEFEAGARS
jgi:hypothetical protein